MWDKCRALIERAKESSDPGYLLAYLLLVLRTDEQGRISANAGSKSLRGFARDLLTYNKLSLALSGNIPSKQYISLIAAMPEECETSFDRKQLKHVKERLGTVAECLESLPKDKESRVKLSLVQEKINELMEAIGRSQKQS